jgi:deferrochelatase/peroxidase EfeB
MDPDRERSIPRRQFVRSAVAIGGASALAACQERERALLGGGDPATATDERTGATATDERGGTGDGLTYPQGDPEAVPAGQHEWSDYLIRDMSGNTVPPQQQLVLGLSYEGSAPPTDAEREQVDAAFRTLTRAFQWGTGGDGGATFNRGLLFLIGYAPSYFEQFGPVPDDLVDPGTLLERVGEDPEKTDGFDATVVLTSDVGSVVLAAEEALLGRTESVNGVPVEGSLDGVFSVAERRTGFAGQGIPAEKLDHDEIPEQAPLSMGFKSGFTDSLPSEEAVKIREGPFAGGTTLALSRLRIELDRWYDQSEEDRVKEMFCPAHDVEEVGPVGTNLGDDSAITEEDVDRIPEHAETYGKVGHSAKVARARDDDFEPRILRRSEGFATDAPEHTGFNFTSVQRSLESFIEARVAMHPEEYDVDVPPENHGIDDYLNTVNRGAYVVPAHEDRALPVPEA